MLNSISIRNFLLIESMDLDFYSGFSVLTGETGAGKSIFLKSILFALGMGKYNSDILMPNTEQASVTLSITSNDSLRSIIAEKTGIEIESEFIIKRIHNKNNRKKFFINNEVVSEDLISDLSIHLLEFHGQNLHNYLANPASHLEILDRFASNEELLIAISEKFSEVTRLKGKLSEIDRERKLIEHEISYLKHIVKELENLNIEEGEEDKLLDIKIKLQNTSKRKEALSNISSYIENCNLENISLNIQKIISRSNLTEFETVSSHLEKAFIEFQEASMLTSNIIMDEDETTYDIDEVEERLLNLRELSRKHSKPISGLPDFLIESQENLSILESKIVNYGNLQEQLKISEAEYNELALKLREIRKEKAVSLEKQINNELSFLKMEQARFFVEFSEGARSQKGTDKITFTAITNKGMKSGAIDKIASGGELARFMLAVRICLFDKDFAGLIIFDEIDTGLGGHVASKIGQRLADLGKVNQILVISHQPQVASLANHHYKIFKSSVDEKTSSNIIKITGETREEEIARMISADKITDAAIEAAKELLQ